MHGVLFPASGSGSWGREAPLDTPPAEPFSLRNAHVRALAFTFVPLYAGAALAQITHPRAGSLTGVTSIGLVSFGAVLGPSLGLFCLGDTASAREGAISLAVRVGGAGLAAYERTWLPKEKHLTVPTFSPIPSAPYPVF